MNSHSLHDGLLGDYCDGSIYAANSLFQDDPCALQIQLYYDELELCNPLGSRKHKLGNSIMHIKSHYVLLLVIAWLQSIPKNRFLLLHFGES